jgi:glyoxylase-like metal-dependent hydrolase (beta-lactamase superfamily II)
MINTIKPNVWQIYFEDFGSCVYLIKSHEYILIDTSSKENEENLLDDLDTLNVGPEKIKAVILTHTHFDHIGNLHLFENARVYSAPKTSEITKHFPEFKIIETPGHTRDSICILYQDILFSGDTIFNDGYIGRTDLPESNHEKMIESLEKLKKINYKILCAGHLV